MAVEDGDETTKVEQLQIEIEERLEQVEPEVEVLALEQTGPERLRLFIDRSGGVDLALCERVTGHLRDLLDDYALEVSSPGLERPLSKPEHFQRFLGHRVRLRTTEPIDGRRSFTGKLTAASGDAVSVEAPEGPVTIPHERIHRSNLIPEEAPKELQS